MMKTISLSFFLPLFPFFSFLRAEILKGELSISPWREASGGGGERVPGRAAEPNCSDLRYAPATCSIVPRKDRRTRSRGLTLVCASQSRAVRSHSLVIFHDR